MTIEGTLMSQTHSILVVDDSQNDFELCKRALANAPGVTYSMLHENDGRRALARLEQEHVDCVLLDHALIGPDGLAVLSQIREQHPAVPIIALTGQGNESIAVRLLKAGARDYITKSSISTTVLHSAIQNAVGGSGIFARRTRNSVQAPVLLIVDDSPEDREACVRAIKSVGNGSYRCIEASTGEAALEVIQEKVPDCVILDYSLPGLTGIDVLKTAVAEHPFLPVIMVTGRGNEAIAAQAIMEGAQHYLIKAEITPDGLYSTIGRSIEHGRFERQISEKDRILSERKAYLDTLIDNIPSMIFVKDETLRFTEINHAGEKLMGIPREGILGRTAYELFSPDQADLAARSDNEVLSDNVTVTVEEEIDTRFGTRCLLTRKAPLAFPNGKKCLLGISEDITDLKKEEVILREIYSTTMDDSYDLSQKAERVLDSGRKYFSMPFGLISECSDMACKPVFMSPANYLDSSAAENYCACVSAQRRNVETDVRMEIFAPIIVDRRHFGTIGFGGSNRQGAGITARGKAFINLIAQWIGNEMARNHDMQEKESLIARLRQSNKELETFTYIASHDLRSPLVNLKGFSSEIRRSMDNLLPILKGIAPTLDADARTVIDRECADRIPKSLDFISGSAEKMDRLTTGILNLSRVGRRELVFESINTRELVEQCVGALGHEIEHANITVTIANLPNVVGDKYSIEQIFGNVLENAVKYRTSSRTPRVDISFSRGDAETAFIIKDNGRGIAESEMHKVFEIFRRGANAGNVPGEGMGMPYVRSMVHRHGGRIWCESAIDVGTAVFFTIPDALKKRVEQI